MDDIERVVIFLIFLFFMALAFILSGKIEDLNRRMIVIETRVSCECKEK